jgi:hypothetical protein
MVVRHHLRLDSKAAAMKTIASLSLLLLISTAPQALTAPSKTLPEGFLGSWNGLCTIVPTETGSAGFQAKLDVKALAGRPGYTWTLDYVLSHFTQEARKYELLPAPDTDTTHFIMDEKTGLMLDSYLVGQTLYSAYFISGKLYDTTYELAPDGGLTIRGPSYGEEIEQTTCLTGSTRLCAKSLQFAGVQICHLKRKP